MTLIELRIDDSDYASGILRSLADFSIDRAAQFRGQRVVHNDDAADAWQSVADQLFQVARDSEEAATQE